VAFATSARAADWPQFLGPNRDGLSAETGLVEAWPAAGLAEVWRAPGGVGQSGLSIADGRLYTLLQRDGQQWIVALDAASGDALWETPLAPEYLNPMSDGPRGTPTIAGQRAYAYTGEGILSAVDLSDGAIAWTHNVPAELDGEAAEYGMACSPLVVGDRVVVTAGAPDATVVAYDAATGEQAWTAGSDHAGYSSPVLREVGGRQQIVVFSGGAALGLAPDTGKVLWRHEYETNFNCNIAAPLAWEGKLFISSGENHGCALLEVKRRGQKFDVAEVWSSQGPKSVMRNEWQTSLLVDGHLYGMDNVGGAGPVTHLNCVAIATGERAWQKARFGKGNLIAADGKLFVTTMEGELVVVRATPEGYEELGRQTVLGPMRQGPSLADGRLYLRDDAEIVCLDARGE
jgi:outer membrane protein assembly factor BamB